MHKSRVLTLSLVAVATAIGGVWLWTGNSLSSEELLARARTALRDSDYAQAEEFAAAVDPGNPLFGDAMLVAGEAAARRKRLPQAAEYYQQAVDSGSSDPLLAQFSLADIQIRTGEITPAIAGFRSILEREPGDLATHSRLALLYTAVARRWDSRSHLELVLKSGSATLDELILLADLERPVDEQQFLEQCHEAFPEDVNVRLGLAAATARNGDIDTAITELREVVAEQHRMLAAQALLGELLSARNDTAFEEWHQSLPDTADTWPDIWYARGLRSVHYGSAEMAAQCFGQALRLSPTHRRANYEMGRVLTELDHPQAAAFAQHAQQLFHLTQSLHKADRSAGSSEVVIREIVTVFAQTGRIWETCAWAQWARERFPRTDWPSTYLQRWAPRLGPELPMVLPDDSPGMFCDLSGFPPFRIQSLESGEGTRSIAGKSSQPRLQFRETPIDMAYFNAADPATPGARMQEQTGGGISVLDVDADSWPDLYLVDGARWPSEQSAPVLSPEYSDHVYRNRRGSEFIDITALANVDVLEFGQSAAVGDVNDDGFDDVYVVSIGMNLLLLNQGDGTFAAPQPIAGGQGHWTSSAAIADLDNDTLADLIDVNYLSGPHVFSQLCGGRACSPSVFSGLPDAAHRNLGDGTFETIPSSTRPEDSKGLGLVVYRDTPQGQTQVFVGNDQTRKFLLSLDHDEQGRAQLQDTAFARGLAYDGNGLLTAAMGIAADDLDQNGLLDFFITNFRDEANTMYLQRSVGLFRDQSRTTGLDMPGVPFVGWGTQFLDAERDGDLDLVVANGHVDDYRDEGGYYEMRPQLLRNLTGTVFEEVTADEAGEYFRQQYLGRGLATLDWNQDGRMDFCVSNINAPASLVTNITDPVGDYINIRLHARTTVRTSEFAQVRLAVDSVTLTRQLCAGGGYHASNERMLQFAFGPHQHLEQLSVTWPSGATTDIARPGRNATLDIYEGHVTAIVHKDGSLQSIAATPGVAVHQETETAPSDP